MAGKSAHDPLTTVNFACRDCGRKFVAAPGRVEDAPEREWHPWQYLAPCPSCGADAPQAAWEQGLMATFGKHTGPKTAEGKAVVTQNLQGHPTPEEARRTRFNAMKHGLFARVASFFPAKPGKYPHCEGCAHLESLECWHAKACLKRTELFLRHQIAFETADPSLLTSLHADRQANVAALIDDMILAIIRDGVRLEAPKTYYDKDGCHVIKYFDEQQDQMVTVKEINAHPLLKVLADFLAKNNMTLGDLAMTPKVQEDANTMRGFLESEKQNQDNMLDFQSRQAKALEGLQALIDRGQQRIQRDPVVIDQEAERG